MKSSAHHSFDIDLAEKYGIEEAILIHHFQHWIRFNQNLKRNFHDGRTWTYQTLEEIAAHFPYFTKSQVFEIIHSLCTGRSRRSGKHPKFSPVLRKGNFNKTKFDKTSWYAFENQEMFTVLAKAEMDRGLSQNPDSEKPTTIPHTPPHSYPDIPPPPSPKKEEIAPPTKQEEEEISKRFRERPKYCPPIKSKKKWRDSVLKDIRAEPKASGVDCNAIEGHRKQSHSWDMKKWRGDLVVAQRNGVEFTCGSSYKKVLYDVSQEEWERETGWKSLTMVNCEKKESL